jgi:hypothetical protein
VGPRGGEGGDSTSCALHAQTNYSQTAGRHWPGSHIDASPNKAGETGARIMEVDQFFWFSDPFCDAVPAAPGAAVGVAGCNSIWE